MGYKRVKTEHGGAKNGGGAWMTRAEAKQSAKRKRRKAEQSMVRQEDIGRGKNPWIDDDPQPEDFDTELEHAQAEQIEIHEGNPKATLRPLAENDRDDLESDDRR
jgi:hypothetical protein